MGSGGGASDDSSMPTPNPTVPEPSVPEEPTTTPESTPVENPQPDQGGNGDEQQPGGGEPAPVV